MHGFNQYKKKMTNYQFPFGEVLHPLTQQDKTPKQVFVLGVYASAVHARWKNGNKTICQALAVASEPRIFWDGNEEEAKEIIGRIHIPAEVGTLEPAGKHLNGPSAKILDERILTPLKLTRKDAWLCDLLPEARLNPGQVKALEKYEQVREQYLLNEVTVPHRPTVFCDEKRSEEILEELNQSQAKTLILLGDIPIKQFLNRVSDVKYTSLQEYVELYGYGKCTEALINHQTMKILPLAHPRQIGALGLHSNKWHELHRLWEKKIGDSKCR